MDFPQILAPQNLSTRHILSSCSSCCLSRTLVLGIRGFFCLCCRTGQGLSGMGVVVQPSSAPHPEELPRSSGLLASGCEGHCEGLAFPFLWFLLCFCHSAVSQAGMLQPGRCCPPAPEQLVLPFSHVVTVVPLCCLLVNEPKLSRAHRRGTGFLAGCFPNRSSLAFLAPRAGSVA